jgi:RNA polymerase sigma-70 factor (ECF subfamily)
MCAHLAGYYFTFPVRIMLLSTQKSEYQTPCSIKEAELIHKLEAKDEAAFKLLVETHKNQVYNTCLGFLRNPHDAEDVSQEVFIQVFDSIGDFREEASLSTWVYRIAVTKSLELIRYRKRKKRSGFFKALNGMFNGVEEETDESEYMHPGIRLENKERAAVLYQEIERLPERQRIAFTLQKVEELSYKEVAQVMELSIPAVESLLHRAKENLKKQLTDYYQQNEMD